MSGSMHRSSKRICRHRPVHVNSEISVIEHLPSGRARRLRSNRLCRFVPRRLDPGRKERSCECPTSINTAVRDVGQCVGIEARIGSVTVRVPSLREDRSVQSGSLLRPTTCPRWRSPVSPSRSTDVSCDRVCRFCLSETADSARWPVFARFIFPARCSCIPSVAMCLSRAVRVRCAPRVLGWPDLAEGGLRLDRLCRNGGRQLFSAAASGFASRSKIAVGRHPPLRCGSDPPRRAGATRDPGCASASSIASGRTIAIEAAMGATR
jgi:hypothetical protein